MRLVVISSPGKFESEIKTVTRLFNCGLETFHLRKPKFSQRRMNEYLSLLPQEHLKNVIIHSHYRLASKYKLKGVHLTEKQKDKKFITGLKLKVLKWTNPDIRITSSFHNIAGLLTDKTHYEYVFLSPVFDSISKKGYGSKFNPSTLQKSLRLLKCANLIALGGIDEDKIEICRELGFTGAAVLGAIWNSKDPIEKFKRINSLCHSFGVKKNESVTSL